MGRYEIIVKTEDIRKRIQEGDLLSAQEILDTIELSKVKNLSDLNLMAGVFKENGRYDEAAELYLRIYEKSKTRKTVAHLVDVFIKSDNISDAEKYLEEYQKYASDDYDSYIFRYKIDKLQAASYEQLQKSLEALKKIDYSEKWAYELAKLYYKAGMDEKCIKECTDIALWFGEGVYVEKAKLLRSYFTNGTDKEKIMEELKRRLEASGDRSQEAGADTDSQEKEEPESTETLSEQSDHSEEEQVPTKKDEFDALYEEVAIALNAELFGETGVFEENLPVEETYVAEEESEINQELEVQEEAQEEAQEEQEELQEEEQGSELEKEEDSVLDYIAKTNGIELEEVFGEFLQEEPVKLQILEVLANLLRIKEKPPVILITGTDQEAIRKLSKALALFIHKAGKLSSSKVAKISAQKLNRIDINSKAETLQGYCLVIEHASELKESTVEEVIVLTKHLHGDFAVIFEDDQISQDQYLVQYPSISESLVGKIQL
jgi:hypothetical protein